MIGNPLQIEDVVPEMGGGGIRVANEVDARRWVLASATNDVLET